MVILESVGPNLPSSKYGSCELGAVEVDCTLPLGPLELICPRQRLNFLDPSHCQWSVCHCWFRSCLNVNSYLAHLESAHFSCSKAEPVAGIAPGTLLKPLNSSSLWLFLDSAAGGWWLVAGSWHLVPGGWQSIQDWYTCQLGLWSPWGCPPSPAHYRTQKLQKAAQITTKELQEACLLFPGYKCGLWEDPWHGWLVARQLWTQHWPWNSAESLAFWKPLLRTLYTGLRASYSESVGIVQIPLKCVSLRTAAVMTHSR